VIVLAVDAGNSRIKWGLYDAGWMRRGVVDTHDPKAFAEAVAGLPVPERIVASNVAGATVRRHIEHSLSALARPVYWVSSVVRQCGVTSGYAAPGQLGTDRWCALIGAWQAYRQACVVVMAGTTLTADALSGQGVFAGGVIVPGAELMRQSLARNTAQLPAAAGAFRYFPDNTDDAIESGIVNALCGAVERIARYLEQAEGQAPLIVLSGGAASLLEPHCGGRRELMDNLVLEGLVHIALEAN